MKKYVSSFISGLATMMIFSLCTLSACSKNKSTNCYNAALQQQYLYTVCPTDCPNVLGCDGETYCNVCTAGKAGIAVPK